MMDPETDVPLHMTITPGWIQSFMERIDNVCQALTGGKYVAPAKKDEIESEATVDVDLMSVN